MAGLAGAFGDVERDRERACGGKKKLLAKQKTRALHSCLEPSQYLLSREGSSFAANAENDAWTSAGTMRDGRVLPAATLLQTGEVLVTGGADVSSAELYAEPVVQDAGMSDTGMSDAAVDPGVADAGMDAATSDAGIDSTRDSGMDPDPTRDAGGSEPPDGGATNDAGQAPAEEGAGDGGCSLGRRGRSGGPLDALLLMLFGILLRRLRS